MIISLPKTVPSQPTTPSEPTDDDLFAIKAADNQDRDWLHEQQASPQGFFALTGEEAWNGLDQFRRQTTERIDRTAQSLPSGTAQKVYRSIATARAEGVLAKAQAHADTQRAETIKAVSQTRLANAISDGADNWHDPREYSKHLGAGMEEVEADARRQGWDEAQTQQAKQTFTSTFAKAAVEKAAATDPHAARTLLESFGNHLPNDREQLAKTLNHSILLTDARKMADTVLANSNGQSLEALLGSLSFMPTPDPALKAEAERMVCVGFLNKEQAQKKANEQAINQALSLIKAGKAPDELPPDLRNHPAVSSQWDQLWDHALSVAGAPAGILAPTPPAAPQEQSQTPPVPASGESPPIRNYSDAATDPHATRTLMESFGGHPFNYRKEFNKALAHSILQTDARTVVDTALGSQPPLTEAERTINARFLNKEQAQDKANEQAISQALSLIKAGKTPDELSFALRSHLEIHNLWGRVSEQTLQTPHVMDPKFGNTRTPPAQKKAIFAKQGKSWSDFNDSVAELPNILDPERFIYPQIFAVEGGDLVDPNSGASSGITKQTLKEARTAKVAAGLDTVALPGDLSTAQRAGIMRWYFERALAKVGGNTAFVNIGDPLAAAALADTLYRHGNNGGTRLIQQAINQVNGNKALPQDGGMGEATLSAYITALSSPERRNELLTMLADIRDTATKGKERERMDHYRP